MAFEKKRSLVLFFILFFPFLTCFAQDVGIKERTLESDEGQRYLVRLPVRYNSEKLHPLFIAIHWLNGTALQQVDEWKFLCNKNGYILVCPQFSEGYQHIRKKEDLRLMEIISEVEREFSVDRNKIYLVGHSGGAQFAHRFAFKHPFMKAVCVLAGGEYDDPPSSVEARKVKYFVGVGEEDKRYKAMTGLYSLLKRKGYDAEFKSFPSVGHILHSSIKSAVIKFLSDL